MASLGQHGSGDHDRADIRAPQEFLNAPDAVDGLQHVRLLGSPAVVPGPQGVGKPIEEVGCRCPVGGADGVGVVIVADVPGVAVGIGNPSERSRDWARIWSLLRLRRGQVNGFQAGCASTDRADRRGAWAPAIFEDVRGNVAQLFPYPFQELSYSACDPIQNHVISSPSAMPTAR